MKTTKKLLVFLIGLLVTCTCLYAQDNIQNETPVFKHGFSVSGYWSADSLRSGGGSEIGFNLGKQKSTWVFRDYFTVAGFGWYSGSGEASVGNKLQFGGKVVNGNLIFFPYGFIHVCGVFLSSSEPQFGCSIGGGGGFEIQYCPSSSFFIEYGGYGVVPQNKGTANLTLGYREYF